MALVLAATAISACGGGGGAKVGVGPDTTTQDTSGLSTGGDTVTTGGSAPSTAKTTATSAPGNNVTTTVTAPKQLTTSTQPRGQACRAAPSGTGPSGKKNQAIVFGDLGTIYEPQTQVTLAACATSGLPVQYTVSQEASPGDCTVKVAANAVEMKAATCTITASQGGNAEFEAAAPVSRVANKGNQDVQLVWVSRLEPSYPPGKITVVLGVRSASPVTAQVAIADMFGICASSGTQSIDNRTNPDLSFEITLNDPPTGSADCNLAPNIGAQFIGAMAPTRTYHIQR